MYLMCDSEPTPFDLELEALDGVLQELAAAFRRGGAAEVAKVRHEQRARGVGVADDGEGDD